MGLASSRPSTATTPRTKTNTGETPSSLERSRPVGEMAPLTRRAKGRSERNVASLPRPPSRQMATSPDSCCHCCCRPATNWGLGSALSGANSLDGRYRFSGCCGPPSGAATTSESNYRTFNAKIIDSITASEQAPTNDSAKHNINKRRSHAKSARNIIGWPPVNHRALTPATTSTTTTTTGGSGTKHQAGAEQAQGKRAADELVARAACELAGGGCCCCCYLWDRRHSVEPRQQAPLCADSAPPVCSEKISPLSARELDGGAELTRRRSSSLAAAGQIATKTELAAAAAAELGRAELAGSEYKRSDEPPGTRTTSHDQFGSYTQAGDQAKATLAHCRHSYNRRMSWSELILRYGKMVDLQQEQPSREKPTTTTPGPISVVSDDGGGGAGEPPRQPPPRTSNVGLGHVLWLLLQALFPILAAFKHYSLPRDLLDDLMAGTTVAILHIPQGMAYGLLSGVEPIYGLYVSFVPVAVMALMSKSRHVSYGTFAIISMLLVNTVSQARARMRSELMMTSAAGSGAATPLVITNNHRPSELSGLAELKSQQLVQQLVQSSSGGQLDPAGRIDSASPLLAEGTGGGGGGGLQDFEQALPSSIEILTCVCLLCGLVHVTMALLRLGALSLMFSDQLVSSFTTAGAIHVATSQLAGLLDMKLEPISGELFKCARVWFQFGQALARGQFNTTTALISLASLAFLLAVKELLEPRLRRRFTRLTCLPSELVLMALLIVVSSRMKLAQEFGVKIVGHVASGLPEPKVPNLDLVPYVWDDALAIALLTFTMNLSIARTYAKKFRYELDPNQELFALGSANLVGSLFSCFPCASSLSRSSVQSSLNVKSQLSSIFSCCLVIAIVCYFAHILHDLPTSTLSCIIMVALKGILMQISDLYENWRLSKLDALVWMISFVSVLAFGVTLGLVIGILASLFMIFFRLLTPNYSLLARLPGTEIYVDKEAFNHFEELDRVQIFRFNSALCYLNRTILKAKIEKLLPGVYEPTGLRAIFSHYHRQWQFGGGGGGGDAAADTSRSQFLVIDCSALSYCDYAGASTLTELIDELADKKVCVMLAACPLKLVQMIAKMQRGSSLLGSSVYPTISDAVGQIEYIRAGETPPRPPAAEKTASLATVTLTSSQLLKPPAEANQENKLDENSIIDLS